MRRAAALLAAVIATLVGLLIGAKPAAAHAALLSTNPPQGAELHQAPTQVSLRFGESVGINAQSIEVTNSAGRRVDLGDPHHPGGDGSRVVIGLRQPLARASYTVVWHVVSADSHPVGGTFSFGYGVPAGAVPQAPGVPAAVRMLHYLGRLLAFLGLAGLIGGGFVLAVIWPAGRRRHAAQRLLRASLAASAVAAAALFVLEGPYGASTGLGHLLDGGLLRSTLHEDFGRMMLARLGLLLVAAAALRLLPARRIEERVLLGLAAAGLALTFALSEHAGQGIQVALAVPVDALHLLAVSVWLGGLAMLLVATAHAERFGDGPDLARWSTAAMTAVAVIVATGAYQTWREVGTLPALWSTTYGQLLLAKWFGLVLLLALANVARSLVRYRLAAGRPDDGRTLPQLRGIVAYEAAIGVAVLAVTAALVNSQPGREAYTPPVDTTISAVDPGGLTIDFDVHISTTKVGPTAITVRPLVPAEHAGHFAEVDGTARLDSPGSQPVRFTLNQSANTTTFTAADIVIPSAGTWDVVLEITTHDGDDYAGQLRYTVRE